ncbi:MAG: tRNA (guanosine(46)-N7)-methyltransferase TrmB, partial [Verrucomicrobia bacterium]|nr:tRNA (guanosine(46)-N7)-methyltransferase TrmB [Verrucomicrobiota bacterium]
KENPDTLWIAVEKRFDRVQRIWAKKHNLFLSNLFVVCGEALTFTKYYLQEGKVDQVFVNFPDPWPKLKHAKHRLLQKPFVQEIKRITKDLGEAILVTDDAPYSQQMIREMTQEGLWSSFFPSPYYVSDWPFYGASYFEELWKSQGRDIYYMKFTK